MATIRVGQVGKHVCDGREFHTRTLTFTNESGESQSINVYANRLEGVGIVADYTDQDVRDYTDQEDD